MYLMIQNVGEADPRSFTTLGLSTSRDQENCIGQFGSGSKHGVLLLLRQGIRPRIYCGRTKIEFFTKPASMNGTEFNQMFVKIGNKTMELSYSLEFGSLDWNQTDMALREFVSNAIDASEHINNVTVDIVENARAKSGYTRIFVPLSDDVQRFYNELTSRFLHFTGNPEETILTKTEPGPARVYRKGVFVRQLDKYTGPSLFDYNFGDEMQIDESRNLDDWNCRAVIGKKISQDESTIRHMFTRFLSGESTNNMESEISEWNLCHEKWWADVWQDVAGDKLILLKSHVAVMRENLQRRGFKTVVVPSGWYTEMQKAGIPTGLDNLSHVENKGATIVPATSMAIATFAKVWNVLVELKLTKHREPPQLACFQQPMEAGSRMLGYYENNTIYINVEFDNNKSTMLEEIAHHITQATDNSRDFQDYAFTVAAQLMDFIYD